MSVILQLAREVDESTSDVVVYGMMSIFPDVSSDEAHEEIKRSCVDVVVYDMMFLSLPSAMVKLAKETKSDASMSSITA